MPHLSDLIRIHHALERRHGRVIGSYRDNDDDVIADGF
jgi:hypothetical protein